MECEDVNPHLSDHLEGTLPEPLAERVSAHLRTCQPCGEEARAIGEVWQMLGHIPTAVHDASAMRTRLDAVVEAYQDGLAVQPRARSRGMLTSIWGTYGVWAQAAAAVLLVSAGVLLGRQTVPAPVVPTDPQLSAVQEELHQMRQLVTLSLLSQQSASDRLKGVNWSGQLKEPGGEVVTALLDALRYDSNVNVRLASIDALRRFGGQEAVRSQAIEALAQQMSPLVQIALIDFLVEARAADSVTVLKQLSEDPALDDEVRARATWGLGKL
jgi:hypothetical protein